VGTVRVSIWNAAGDEVLTLDVVGSLHELHTSERASRDKAGPWMGSADQSQGSIDHFATIKSRKFPLDFYSISTPSPRPFVHEDWVREDDEVTGTCPDMPSVWNE
jgi:hypothetical protein